MRKLHVISHTHWDREWYLTYQQFRLKLVHLIDKLLDILAQDPEFKYYLLDGQTIIIDDYLQIRPEKEEILRQHIQKGRILIGPWHILPDMFLVSPEAHIRNLLEGARTAQKFGPKMPIGYIPDPFGHPAQVPQILRGFGIEAAALWRGLSDQPAELLWESPDGSKVLLAYLRDSYSNGANLPIRNFPLFAQQISIGGDSLASHSAVNDYLIMLGTDHMEASPYTAAALSYANEHLTDTQVIHSSLPAYIQSITDQISKLGTTLPTIKGELRACDRSHLLPGVLSTRIWIKQQNHSSQILLEKWAEPFSVFVEKMIETEKNTRISPEYRTNRIHNVAPIIRNAWRMLMENHPHDSICGCSIDQVHNEMKPRFDQVGQIGEEITLQALQTISRTVQTLADDRLTAIVLFNPFGFSHRDLIEIELNIPEEVSDFELHDAEGNLIPHEYLGSNHEELANLLLEKNNLRDTIGAINEGWIAGSAIVNVKVTRQNNIATINAILDDQGQPNIPEWHQAEEEIAKYEADPSISQFHLLAYTPQTSKIRFISPDIPAFGWQTVWARAIEATKVTSKSELNSIVKKLLPLGIRFAQSKFGEKILSKMVKTQEKKPPFIIENEYFLVEVKQADGTLTITDKKTNSVLNGLNSFVDGGDAGDEYNYSPPLHDSFFTPKVVSLKNFHSKFAPAIEIEYELSIPVDISSDRKKRSSKNVCIPLRSRVSLANGVARVDVSTEIDNKAKDHRLRVHFPAPFLVEEADYDGHFEVIRRATGIPDKGENWVEDPRPEVPQRAFTDVSNGNMGLMIANRGLPEVEVIKFNDTAQTEIALTLLRCVGWLSRDDLPVRRGHAGPAFETPGGQMPGKWTFDYAIIPHSGYWREAFQQAYAFETPLRAIETNLQEGLLPQQGSFIIHTPGEFVISAVKVSENGEGFVVRGYNVAAEPIQLNIKPLVTYKKAMLVNLAEEALSILDPDNDGSVMLSVSGNKVISIKFVI